MLWPPWDGGCEICQKSDGPDGLDGLDGPDSVDAIFLASWIVKLGGEGRGDGPCFARSVAASFTLLQ